MSKLIKLCGDTDIKVEPVITFPFECDNFQKHAFNEIENGHDILLNAPTSSGKTIIGIYGIMKSVIRMKKKGIYVCPIKTLSNQKYNDFCKYIYDKFKDTITVGILTGDRKINPNADIIIATAEILRNSLFNILENKETECMFPHISTIGCVVMDEIHYINDEGRGTVWEEMIMFLPKEIQIIMLSGTIGNYEYFGNWVVSIRDKNLGVICHDKRLVPLKHIIFCNNKIFEYIDINNKYIENQFLLANIEHNEKMDELKKKKKYYTERQDIYNLVYYLKNNDMLNAIIFCFSKDKCKKYAEMIDTINLLNDDERNRMNNIFDEKIMRQMDEKGEKMYEKIVEIHEMKKLLNCGIAYHHSDVISILREIIEILVCEKLIKIVFATETFCTGVNVPARTCVFTGLIKPTEKGKRNINTGEYLQMAGRAGRRGIDKSGNIIFLPLDVFPYRNDFENIVLGKIPDLKSNFGLTNQIILKLALNNNNEPIKTLKKSLMNAENLDKIIQEKQKQENLRIKINEILKIIDDLDIITNLNVNEKELINKYIEYEKKYFNNDNNILIKMTKNQEKDFKEKKNIIMSNQHYKNIYNNKKIYEKLNDEIEIIKNNILMYENYIDIRYNKFCIFLKNIEYINQNHNQNIILKNDITMKGIICSQINECNSVLMTEIIMNRYLNNLSVQEIVSVLSIFSDNNEIFKNENIKDFEGTENIHNVIDEIIILISNMEKIENKYLMDDQKTKYIISTYYIDITYCWADGYSIYEMNNILDEYLISIEQFCKVIRKISNIILTLINIYSMCKYDIEIINNLKLANEIILRSIVNTNSLY